MIYVLSFNCSINGTSPPGFLLQWHFFFNNLPPVEEAAALPDHLWMLRHTQRQAKPVVNASAGCFKALYDMNVVRGVFSHGTLLCLTGT